ncbi:MAG TPA: glycoside hydrolase family 2 TIM barrel-domain containing protein [Opitutaceae bacterium]|nr:glycoside hydrolase family 2 TIM barrel-domain containing protein [Opitutaceae bacterium]
MRAIPLYRGWNFRRLEPNGAPAHAWTGVELPHAAHVTDIDGNNHWQGLCEYELVVPPPAFPDFGRYALYIGAAMHTAVVSIDGVEAVRHVGGYLPFEIDLTETFRDGQSHVVTLRLDNRDNPDVPPGKPLAELDFCWHSGLYRDAELRTYPKIHFTDPVAANAVASGGLFVRTLEATSASATLSVQAHFQNASPDRAHVGLAVEVLEGNSVVAKSNAAPREVPAGVASTLDCEIALERPALWSTDAPNLYSVRASLLAKDGAILDSRVERIGVRTISFSRSAGFVLNGRSLRLRGVNRHQEYPYVGYAVPPAAHHRDARRIKEAGFDYVRLSHYPQAPEFLEACDELGIVVMNCIPGWQFLGGETFRQASFQNARDLIRRDRNHPCVVLWELSLNETSMDESFMAHLQAIGHEELPGGQIFTCGWIDRYDVYLHSRQHGEIHRWQNGDKALVIAEYGDWEFFASNEGFNQKTGAGRFANWSHGRQLRAFGERGLRQQAVNHIIAHNDTMNSPAALDGLWSMFDYTRGYDLDRAACGIMDVFRLPKFSYHFFRSQRDIGEGGKNWTGGPELFIASYWLPNSDLRVLIFSNCEEVELRLNGMKVGRKHPDKTWMSQYLPHPPFVFELLKFETGTLEAIGFRGGQPIASHRAATPKSPVKLEIQIDDAGVVAANDEPDLIIAHASVLDEANSLCVNAEGKVRFDIAGDAEIAGPAEIVLEAGMASVLLRLKLGRAAYRLVASHVSPGGQSFSATRERTMTPTPETRKVG